MTFCAAFQRGSISRVFFMGWRCWLFVGCLGILQAEDRPPRVPRPVRDSGQIITITADDVRPHVHALAQPDQRGRGPEDREAAREYLLARYREYGLKPLFGESYLQPLPAGRIGEALETFIGANIGGYLPATDPTLRSEWLIINAHYDHLGVRQGRVYPGADDNASGVAMLLETARQLSQAEVRPRRNIAFVAFDLEEQLLWGSRWFVAQPPFPLEQLKYCITADLLGRSLGNLPFRAVFVMGSEHTPEVRELLAQSHPADELEVLPLGADIVGTRSDYGPFRDQRIPFLFFSTGEHPDYHTPRDTPDKIDYQKLAEISTLIARVTHELSLREEVPGWQRPDPANLLDARTVNRVAREVLNADQAGLMQLSGLNRAFISQVEIRTANVLRREKLSPDERSWLVRAAQFMMYSLF